MTTGENTMSLLLLTSKATIYVTSKRKNGSAPECYMIGSFPYTNKLARMSSEDTMFQ